LLVRAARLPGAHRAGAARPLACRKRRVLPARQGRADHMTAAIPLIVLLLALLFGVPISVALAGSGMLGIWMITGDLSKVLAIVSLTPFSTVADYALTTIPMCILLPYFSASSVLTCDHFQEAVIWHSPITS